MAHFVRVLGIALLRHLVFFGVAIIGAVRCSKGGPNLPFCQVLDFTYELLLVPVGQFVEPIELWSRPVLIASLFWGGAAKIIYWWFFCRET